MTSKNRRGFSLMELLAAVTLIGIVAAIVIPRFSSHVSSSKKTACRMNCAQVEVQTQLWYRTKGSWPAANLSNIGADTKYFPDGVPTCPIDHTAYTINASTGKIVGHAH